MGALGRAFPFVFSLISLPSPRAGLSVPVLSPYSCRTLVVQCRSFYLPQKGVFLDELLYYNLLLFWFPS